MTITEERIQAEVAAEIRRIEAWNATQQNTPTWIAFLSEKAIISLANHLVRNRLQVETGAAELRAKGHALGQNVLHHPARCKVTGGCYLCQAEKVEVAR